MADHIPPDELPALDAAPSRRHREIRLAPWQPVLAGMTVGAALFAAGTAFMKIVGP